MENKKIWWSAVAGTIIASGIFLSRYHDYFIMICFLGLLIFGFILTPPKENPKK
ncbi:hypothetical protein [Kaistella antarctica]|uniref:Uncharacterized protein n=1 Tax=Kaistella antarctica TaxID=266748 RepID=A0A448NS83_9FLAO|nr:hypothetical protein [Kaistella antarctica]SEV79734.1 hypothetical protein SAMN05421765_0038 [Kaistella antarctica]VEH99914.1 Uncharacterised protein [Kaistella antarctica]